MVWWRPVGQNRDVLGKAMEKKQSKYGGQRPHIVWMLWLKRRQGWPCTRLMPGCDRHVSGPMDGICQLWQEPHKHGKRGCTRGVPCLVFWVLHPARTCPACWLDGDSPNNPQPLLSTQRGEGEQDAQPAPHAMHEEAKGH